MSVRNALPFEVITEATQPTFQMDDRCGHCREFDLDGCPNCGPETIAKVFNPADADDPGPYEQMLAASKRHSPTAQCLDQECRLCGIRDCPLGDPRHYHYKGCPSCRTKESKHGK